MEARLTSAWLPMAVGSIGKLFLFPYDWDGVYRVGRITEYLKADLS
jgi:hypothetical protein